MDGWTFGAFAWCELPGRMAMVPVLGGLGEEAIVALPLECLARHCRHLMRHEEAAGEHYSMVEAWTWSDLLRIVLDVRGQIHFGALDAGPGVEVTSCHLAQVRGIVPPHLLGMGLEWRLTCDDSCHCSLDAAAAVPSLYAAAAALVGDGDAWQSYPCLIILPLPYYDEEQLLPETSTEEFESSEDCYS